MLKKRSLYDIMYWKYYDVKYEMSMVILIILLTLIK